MKESYAAVAKAKKLQELEEIKIARDRLKERHQWEEFNRQQQKRKKQEDQRLKR